KVARLAVGATGQAAGGDTIRLKPEVTQERHVEGLPPGTRGGVRIPYNFPQDGEYEISVRLVRDRNEMIEGLRAPATVEFLFDRAQLGVFTVKPPGADKNWEEVDRHLQHRLEVAAGPHELAVTFPAQPYALFETVREPYVSRFNIFRHPRTAPAVYQVSITGPFHPRGPGATPGRRRILAPLAGLAAGANAEARARAVLAPLMRRAYRRPVVEADFVGPLRQFNDAGGDFDLGIERALAAVLVNPQFLFRIERDPRDAAPGTVHAVSQLELASRLSFFLWSSLPDDELLDHAGRGDLRQPAVLEKQVRRMLADG
ncbi:MAG: DUF1592 domain-containing protein, partial [Oleiharenicola lentus]